MAASRPRSSAAPGEPDTETLDRSGRSTDSLYATQRNLPSLLTQRSKPSPPTEACNAVPRTRNVSRRGPGCRAQVRSPAGARVATPAIGSLYRWAAGPPRGTVKSVCRRSIGWPQAMAPPALRHANPWLRGDGTSRRRGSVPPVNPRRLSHRADPSRGPAGSRTRCARV